MTSRDLPVTVSGVLKELIPLRPQLSLELRDRRRAEPIEEFPHSIARKEFVNFTNEVVHLRGKDSQSVVTNVADRVVTRFAVHAYA